MIIWKNTCGESWQDTIENCWEVSGKPGTFLFFIPKGALTHHPEGAVVLPAATVRSARRMRLLRQPPDNATAPMGAAVIVCADGKFPATSAENWGRNSLPYVAACLRKPATGSFAAEMDGRSARPFSLLRKRNRKKKRGERAMAIYHLEAKVVSRGAGRSAVDASA